MAANPEAKIPTGEPSKDLEPRPKVLVTFYGINHAPLNLQCLERYQEVLSEHLERSSGQRSILIEGPTTSDRSAQSFKKMAKDFGGWGNLYIARILIEESGTMPKDYQIRARRKQIESSNLQTVLSSRLIPEPSILSFYEFQMIDRINEYGAGLNVDYETHSQGLIEKLTTIWNRADSAKNLAYINWQEGNFDQMIIELKKGWKLIYEGGQIREKDLKAKLEENIKKMIKSPQGGSIFIVFGDDHHQMIEDLARKLSFAHTVHFDIARSTCRFSILDEKVDSLGNSNAINTIEDVFFAQNILGAILVDVIATRLKGRGETDYLAANYETLTSAMIGLSETFSLEEIRALCENKVDLLSLIQNHPLAAPFADILD